MSKPCHPSATHRVCKCAGMPRTSALGRWCPLHHVAFLPQVGAASSDGAARPEHPGAHHGRCRSALADHAMRDPVSGALVDCHIKTHIGRAQECTASHWHPTTRTTPYDTACTLAPYVAVSSPGAGEDIHCVTVTQDPAARLLVSTATLLADVQLPGHGGDGAGGSETAVRRAELQGRLEPHLSRRVATSGTSGAYRGSCKPPQACSPPGVCLSRCAIESVLMGCHMGNAARKGLHPSNALHNYIACSILERACPVWIRHGVQLK